MERPEFLRTSLSRSQQVAISPLPHSSEAVPCAITLSSRSALPRIVGEQPDSQEGSGFRIKYLRDYGVPCFRVVAEDVDAFLEL